MNNSCNSLHIMYTGELYILSASNLQGLADGGGKAQKLVILRWVSINPFSAGTVFIRQILTYKDGPRTKKYKIFLVVVDP